MSGVFGAVDSERSTDVDALTDEMARAMSHREWFVTDRLVDRTRNLAMGRIGIGVFNREQQPVYSEDRSLAIFLSGELHNAKEICRQLKAKGRPFRNDDDLDLVLQLYEEEGEQFIDLPYVVKGNDVSYSGLLTAAVRAYQEGTRIEDLCHSLQEVAFAMLTEAVERALAHTEHQELLLTGGVAANQRLRRMLELIARDHDARFYVIPREYSGDCGAQIAWTGIRAYQAGVQVNVEESRVKPRWRLDAVPVSWR